MGFLERAGAAAQTIGASDCERIADELLAQPANALTSLAYVAVAVAILVVAHRRNAVDRLTVTYVALLAAVGVGSVLFHGPQPAGSRLLHDLPIVLLLLLMALHDLSLLRPITRGPAPFVLGAVVAAAATAAVPDLAAVLTGILAVVLAGLEVVVFRRGRRDASRAHQIRMYVAMGSVLAVAGGLYALGRTDSPLCDPESIVQLHGMWHVASAVVFGLWWWLALARPASPAVPATREARVTQG